MFFFFIGNTDLSKVQTIKIQQFPFSSYDLSIGKYLENAVDEFINSYYEKKPTINNTEINYLAFFGSTEKMKKLLVEECKFIKLLNNLLYSIQVKTIHFCACILSCWNSLTS